MGANKETNGKILVQKQAEVLTGEHIVIPDGYTGYAGTDTLTIVVSGDGDSEDWEEATKQMIAAIDSFINEKIEETRSELNQQPPQSELIIKQE